ncbi:MAG: AMP-binding protein [SAR86 cluster bacterium]
MILTRLKHHVAAGLAERVALCGDAGEMTYAQLVQQVEHLATWLQAHNVRSLALHWENSPAWVVVDLACQAATVIFTPIPTFFTQSQIDHLLAELQPDMVLGNTVPPLGKSVGDALPSINAYQLAVTAEVLLPPKTSKVTFTSGSTGAPKGVCLSVDNQLAVVHSLIDVIALPAPRHLCLLPLATLLENIAGIYCPLMLGGCIHLVSDQGRGFSGSRLTDPMALLGAITKAEPETLILVPELLQLLVIASGMGWQAPASLRFIAVGGSKVAPALLARARALGLPVHQGYGISECASVVSLATADNSHADSVGRILPHLTVTIIDSELVVSGNTFLGYINQPESWAAPCVYTGDIAEMRGDELFINGRLKNVLINSFGRNLSPEWVEAELMATGLFQQAVVVGDSRPYCIGLLAPFAADTTAEQIMQALGAANANLPDYAQVHHYIKLAEPLSFDAGLMTANGRPQREPILTHFQQDIDQVYASNADHPQEQIR